MDNKKCSKVMFDSLDEAEAAKLVINNKLGFNLKRAYYCKKCFSWHLTSRDPVSFYRVKLKQQKIIKAQRLAEKQAEADEYWKAWETDSRNLT